MRYIALISFFLLSTVSNNQAQDALNMKLMAHVTGLGLDYNDCWGYQHGSKEFAVIGSDSMINVFDVTDCGSPILVHQWDDGSKVIWRDFKDYKDYIYGICDSNSCGEGLQIINKNDFSQSQITADFTRAHNIHIDKSRGKLYVMGSHSGAFQGMLVYDLEPDPATPTLIKVLNFRTVTNDTEGSYYVHDAYIQNDTAYCNHGGPGLRIWDLSDLDNVQLISEEPGIGGYNHSSWKHPKEPYLYVATETHGKKLSVVDLSDFANPITTYTFSDPLLTSVTNNIAHNPFVYLNRLYVSYYHDGLQIYDVSDPDLPVRIAYYDTYPSNTNYASFHGAWGVYPFLPSGCIIVSDIETGLYTFKLTIKPESDNVIETGDIIIDDPTKGIIFLTTENEYVRGTVSNDGKFVLETIPDAPVSTLEVINSNVRFVSETQGIILINPAGIYHRIGVDDLGTITVTALASMPTGGLLLEGEDLFLSQYRAGVIMKAPGGDCYHLTIGDSVLREVTEVGCD